MKDALWVKLWQHNFPIVIVVKLLIKELKFCEVSENPKSSICWKFQLSFSKTVETSQKWASISQNPVPLYRFYRFLTQIRSWKVFLLIAKVLRFPPNYLFQFLKSFESSCFTVNCHGFFSIILLWFIIIISGEATRCDMGQISTLLQNKHNNVWRFT